MSEVLIEHDATIWMINSIPARMFYCGRRWRVTDVPTRLTEPVRAMPLDGPHDMFGWRFQATDDRGDSYVFDVYRDDNDWHVHRTYV